jgi:Epoxide hydrolase N terminus
MHQIPSDEIVEGSVTSTAMTVMPPSSTSVIAPFKINVPQSALDDLKRRLDMTRWPNPETVSDWSQGVPLAWVRALVDYWRTQYDWRRCETMLNGLGQYCTEIDGLGSTSSTCAPGIRTPCRSCSATAGRVRSSNSLRNRVVTPHKALSEIFSEAG